MYVSYKDAVSLVRKQNRMDILLTMMNLNLYSENRIEVFCQMLCRIDRAMLTTSTTETELKMSETTLHVATYMGICQFVNAVEESQDLTIILKKSNDRFVKSGQLLVGFVATGVVGTATVEDITSAVATIVLWYSLAIRETIDSNHERALAIVLGEGGRSIHGMGMVDVTRGSAIAVGTIDSRLFDTGETGHLGETAQHVDQIRIGKAVELEQFAQVLDGRGDGIDEVALLFEIATEAIGTQHL